MAAPKRSILSLAVVLAFSGAGLFAAPTGGIFGYLAHPVALCPGMGGLYVVNLDPYAGVGSTDLITNTVDVGLVYPVARISALSFDFEPTATFYYSTYGWSEANKAVPIDPMWRDVYMFGLVLDFPVTFTVPIGARFAFSAGLGPAFDLRVGLNADPTSVTAATVDDINSYFWSQGRFFLPSTLLRFSYKVNDRFAFDLDARAYWPIFNFWAGDGLGFFDQAIFGIRLSARITLPKPKSD
jgi:hypothetical protein